MLATQTTKSDALRAWALSQVGSPYVMGGTGQRCTPADALRAWALSQVGSPYVMGGTGQRCTPAYRKARAEQYPASADAIRRNCPVLRGKQAACAGCKYDGKPCYDCAQLVRRGCAAAGIEGVAISGATSQWRKGDWLRKGGIQDTPAGVVCMLYREDKPAREAARPTKPDKGGQRPTEGMQAWACAPKPSTGVSLGWAVKDSADEALRRAEPPPQCGVAPTGQRLRSVAKVTASTGASLGWATCRMGHVGIALGDGTIVHASGHDTGVVRTKISAGRWTHYAIPKGMDVVVDGVTDAPEDKPGDGRNRDTIRKGARGPTVVEAQGLLLRAGYPLPRHGADGSFGAETEAAVRAFQQKSGLTADGIVGPLTWAALDQAADGGTAMLCTVTIPGLSREEAEELAGLYPGATVREAVGWTG